MLLLSSGADERRMIDRALRLDIRFRADFVAEVGDRLGEARHQRVAWLVTTASRYLHYRSAPTR
jgi:hypothetical protein